MKQIIFDDCNNNTKYLQEIFARIISKHKKQIVWTIVEFEAVPIDDGDYSGIGSVTKKCRDVVYIFQQKIMSERAVALEHNEFVDLLSNIKTVYEAVLKTSIDGETCEIIISDGDIVKIIGIIERYFD